MKLPDDVRLGIQDCFDSPPNSLEIMAFETIVRDCAMVCRDLQLHRDEDWKNNRDTDATASACERLILARYGLKECDHA